MQVESPEKIRNLAVVGHNDTGKTTLASALLYTGGVANRLNRVEDGNTVTDFDPQEIERQISIGLAPCFVPWQKNKINLVDCPGYAIFFSESRAAIRATDAALLCVNAASGVEVTTEKVWALAAETGVPVMLHLTKMDRERADLDMALGGLRESFDRAIVPLQIPIGTEHDFEGVIDLVGSKANTFKRDGSGKATAGEIPEALQETFEVRRNELIEAVAETDDQLLEKFFDEGSLSQEELLSGLRKAIRERKIFPLTLSAAAHGIGSSALLDSIVELMPSPLERGMFPATNVGGEAVEVEPTADGSTAALVFKTMSDPFTGKVSLLRVMRGELVSDTNYWNTAEEADERVGHLLAIQGKQGKEISRLVTGDIGAVAKLKSTHSGHTLCDKNQPVNLGWIYMREAAISYAIEPKAKGDEEKIGEALHRLMEEDPTLRGHRDRETGEYLLAGTGALHVEIAVAKLKQRFGVEVVLHAPKVAYRETIRKPADGHGRHKKQSGGRGQFADCSIKIEPLPKGEDFEFLDEIFGGSIPQQYRPAVHKGIAEARMKGFLAGYPVVDFRVRLLDGKYHDVDSSEMAFKIAGSMAFKDAMGKAAARLIEPVMSVEISTSDEFMGDIMSDLSQRRGKPQGMETKSNKQIVKAMVPLAEMLTYEPALRSMTQGRSNFHMEFSHYEEVPKSVQNKIITDAAKQKEAGA
ncbi:MAG: elongation factor G [Acidobacteriota bacterium]|nr:elongation factor G [Acidobacteriota bacterium]